VAKGAHLIVVRKQRRHREEGSGDKIYLSKSYSSDMFLLTRAYLLIAHPAKNSSVD
jgi:hypothetical protein